MISELTYKIVAYQDIQEVDSNESVDWAIEMLELGFETESLLMLASFNKPTNYFEVINYVKKSIEELKLEVKSGNDAIMSYSAFYVHKIAKKNNIRENLTELYKYCQKWNYEDLVYDFYLLYWAWGDIDYEDIDYSSYWEGANKENIEGIVIKTAEEWILKNKKHYAQLLF